MNKSFDFLSQHSKKNCLFYFGRPDVNMRMRNINLSNSGDFFRCVKHLQNKHASKFFTNSVAQFDVNIKNHPSEHLGIIRHFNDLYYVRVAVKENRVGIKVYKINPKQYPNRLCKYIVEFQNKDTTLVKYGSIALQKRNIGDSLNDTSMTGLQSVFGDIDNLKITIKIDLYVTCARCSNIVALSPTEAIYVMREHWNCLDCADMSLRTCGQRWQDCEFEDNIEKQKKHTLFFCTFRNICYICRESVRSEDGGPIAHYTEKHQSITHLTHTTFCLTKGSQYCLLEHEGQLLVCRYHLDDNELQFSIRSPWEEDYVRATPCDITLTVKSETKKYKMLNSLVRFDDWFIHLNSWTFENWCSQIDVSIAYGQPQM